VRELAATGETIGRICGPHHQVRRAPAFRGRQSRAMRRDPAELLDLGCHSFCLSATCTTKKPSAFGKWVMAPLRERNRERMLAA